MANTAGVGDGFFNRAFKALVLKPIKAVGRAFSWVNKYVFKKYGAPVLGSILLAIPALFGAYQYSNRNAQKEITAAKERISNVRTRPAKPLNLDGTSKKSLEAAGYNTSNPKDVERAKQVRASWRAEAHLREAAAKDWEKLRQNPTPEMIKAAGGKSALLSWEEMGPAFQEKYIAVYKNKIEKQAALQKAGTQR